MSIISRCLSILFLTLGWGSCPALAQSGDYSRLNSIFNQANRLYQENKYDQAIAEYEKIIGRGFESGPLYYNLGNSYFKKGEPGRALLNYERARLFIPRDSDLKSNRDYTESLLDINAGEPTGSGFLERMDRAFQDVPVDALTCFLSALYTGIFIMLIINLFAKPGRGFLAAGLSIFLVFFVFSAIGLTRKIYWLNRGALVIIKETEAKFEPRDNATTFFKLKEGGPVEIIESSGPWHKIRRADAKRGWVRQNTVEKLGH